MESTQRVYGQLAPRYDQRWKAYVTHSIRETLLRTPRQKGDRILDLGCGTGILLDALFEEKQGYTLVGVDPVEAMLSQARTRLPEEVALHHGSAEKLPFVPHSFQLIVSTSVWHYLREPELVLSNLADLLHPGGMLVLTDWCADFLPMRLTDWWLKHTHAAYHRTLTQKQLARQLSHAGFSVESIDRYKISPWWGLMTAVARKLK